MNELKHIAFDRILNAKWPHRRKSAKELKAVTLHIKIQNESM